MSSDARRSRRSSSVRPSVRYAITRDGVRVAYEQSGRGIPLVFVHGLGDDRHTWRDAIDRLSTDHHCIALDLRGHGQTTGAARFDPFSLLHDLAAVIDEATQQPVVLIGHSLGGFAVSMFAADAERRVRAVINVDQPLQFDGMHGAIAPLEAPLREGRVYDIVSDVIDSLGTDALCAEERERLESARRKLTKEVVLGVWGPLFDGQLQTFSERVELALRAIDVPYLNLFGRDGQSDYEAWLCERVRTLELDAFCSAGHFVHLADPQAFVERVRRFVGARTARGSAPSGTRDESAR